MGSLVQYLILVPGREFCSFLEEPVPEHVLHALDENRCISFEGRLRGSDMWLCLDVSPVATQCSAEEKWTPLFTSRREPEAIQWQKEKLAKLLKFESHLKQLFPGKKILRIDGFLLEEWGGMISNAKNLGEIEDMQSPPDFYGDTYYGWLCEMKYVEPFFEWLKENSPPDYPEQPAEYKGWVELQ